MILWFYVIYLKREKFFSQTPCEPGRAIMVKMSYIMIYLWIVKIRV